MFFLLFYSQVIITRYQFLHQSQSSHTVYASSFSLVSVCFSPEWHLKPLSAYKMSKCLCWLLQRVCLLNVITECGQAGHTASLLACFCRCVIQSFRIAESIDIQLYIFKWLLPFDNKLFFHKIAFTQECTSWLQLVNKGAIQHNRLG